MREYGADKILASNPGSWGVQCIPFRGSSKRSRRKILLVDGEQDQHFLCEQVLREGGNLVVSANSGKEALRYLEDLSIDLIVLDIVTPESDGIETLNKIAARYGEIPIILYTAYPSCHADFMTWLADAVVAKSSDFSILKKTVERLLKSEGKGDSRLCARERTGSQSSRWSGHLQFLYSFVPWSLLSLI
jgi:CheY-like chemotaxis protein